jgi:hypothetical protein
MKDKAEQFIFDWLRNDPVGVNILDRDFVDKFVEHTGARIQVMLWGANKCPYLSKTLSRMYADGKLNRDSMSLGANWQPGFPKWVYCYTL